jgi:hypothetical protein
LVSVPATIIRSDWRGLARGAGLMARAEQVQSMCGRTAYPSLTGQDFCGKFSYLDLNTHPACNDKGRTLPICVTKPNGGSADINTSTGVWTQLPAKFRYEADVPPMPVLQGAWLAAGAHQLFAGGNGSGAALHFHGAAYNAVFFGVKHWLLTPPRYSGISGAASTVWRDRHAPRDLPGGAGMPFRCTQGPGDMLVVPNHWGHATINEAFSIGIGDLFCDRLLSSLIGDERCGHPFVSMQTQPPVQRLAGLWTNLTGRPPAGALSSKLATGRSRGRGSIYLGMGRWEADGAARKTTGRGGASGGGAGGRPPAGRRSLRAADVLLGGARDQGRLVHARQLGASGHATGLSGMDPYAKQASTLHKVPTPWGAGGAPRPVRQPLPPGCAKGGANYSTVAFVHVNKAGGTMMRAALLTHASHQMIETGAAEAVAKLRSVGARFFHASASLQRWAVGQPAWVKAYKFALVRNPWSRQVRRDERQVSAAETDAHRWPRTLGLPLARQAGSYLRPVARIHRPPPPALLIGACLAL